MTTGDQKWESSHITLYHYMGRDLGLKGAELLTLAALRSFARGDGEVETTVGFFGFWSGRCRRSSGQAVADLVSKGLISRRERRVMGAGSRVSYRLTERGIGRIEGDVPLDAPRLEFVTLHGFYVTRLGLTGADLVAYAVIAEATHDGLAREIPLSWLASWLGSTVNTARSAVARLVRRGLVERRDPARGGAACAYALGPAALTVDDAVEIAFGDRAAAPEKAPAGASDPRRADFQELRLSVNNTRGFDYGWGRYRALRDAGRTHAEIRRAVEAAAQAQREGNPEREERFFPHCERTIKQAERILAGKQPRGGRRPGRKRGGGAPAPRPVTFRLTREERPWVVAELPDGSHALVCEWSEGMGRAEMEERLRATDAWARYERGLS